MKILGLAFSKKSIVQELFTVKKKKEIKKKRIGKRSTSAKLPDIALWLKHSTIFGRVLY